MHSCIHLFIVSQHALGVWVGLGGVCPGGCLPGGCLPRGVSTRGVSAQGVSARGLSAQGGVCTGGVCLGVSASGPGEVCIPACNGADTPPPVDRQTPVTPSFAGSNNQLFTIICVKCQH